jgi:glycosyltransferase involved in cell wall biosynthesis
MSAARVQSGARVRAGTPYPRPIRLACVAVEPVFYQVPLYRRLADDERVQLKVYFASDAGVQPHHAGFGGNPIRWDVELLDGYESEFVLKAQQNSRRNSFFALRDTDLFSRIRRGNFDAIWIHGYSYLTLWLAIAAARISRLPLLIREEQTLLESRPVARAAWRSVVLRSLFKNSYALSIGSHNRDFFAHYGVKAERIFHAPYAVDNAALQAQAQELRPKKSSLRRNFGIGEGAGPLVLFVGKLVEKKRPLDLLRAFREVRNQGQCSLLFVGDGPLRGELQEASATLPDVHFAGFLNRREMPKALAAADVFVLPSVHHETWGLVVNEALNFSLPVVTTSKVGSSRDLVRHGVNGFVVPPCDPQALSQALRRLVSDPSLRAQFGAESLRRVSDWSYETAADGIVTACRLAIGQGNDE